MKKINVLYIIWSLDLGGAERVVVNLAKGIDRSRFNPTVCCLNWPGAYADELKKEGIAVVSLRKKKGIDLGIIRKIIRVIKEYNIDIVHTHLWTANFWGRIAACFARVRVIIASEHGISEQRPRIRFLADRILSRCSDCITFVSHNVLKQFGKLVCYDQRKLRVIYNGVSVESFETQRSRPLLREFGIKHHEAVISCIGRISKEKGHYYLLEAMKRLNGKYNATLLVVGDGPLRKKLEASVSRRKYRHKVIFAGFRKDIYRILTITDVLAIPSLREAHSMAALEAMAHGVPIVSANVGGMNEIVVQNKTGLLVPAANIQGLTHALDKVLNNKELRRNMAHASKQRVRELFSLERMIHDTEFLYNRLLKEKVKNNV